MQIGLQQYEVIIGITQKLGREKETQWNFLNEVNASTSHILEHSFIIMTHLPKRFFLLKAKSFQPFIDKNYLQRNTRWPIKIVSGWHRRKMLTVLRWHQWGGREHKKQLESLFGRNVKKIKYFRIHFEDSLLWIYSKPAYHTYDYILIRRKKIMFK